jgi:hypothetical protein
VLALAQTIEQVLHQAIGGAQIDSIRLALCQRRLIGIQEGRAELLGLARLDL